MTNRGYVPEVEQKVADDAARNFLAAKDFGREYIVLKVDSELEKQLAAGVVKSVLFETGLLGWTVD